MTMSLDLGSGPEPKNPFGANSVYGIDVSDFGLKNISVVRLGFEPIPHHDASFDFVSAFDLLEHIPRYSDVAPFNNPFIFLMCEIHRILKPNGQFYAQTPAYPYPTAFSDPTHVNIITSDTVRYFATELTGDGQLIADDRLELGKRYGFTGSFTALRNTSSPAFGHQIWLLRKTVN